MGPLDLSVKLRRIASKLDSSHNPGKLVVLADLRKLVAAVELPPLSIPSDVEALWLSYLDEAVVGDYYVRPGDFAAYLEDHGKPSYDIQYGDFRPETPTDIDWYDLVALAFDKGYLVEQQGSDKWNARKR